MANSKKKGNPTATLVELREDHYVYNEATGFLITSKSMAGKEYDPDDQNWAKAVEDGKIIPIELYQDDSFVIRVVLNAALTEAEEDEWVGKFTHKLTVPDGQLVVCGGIEYVMEPAGDDSSWIDEYTSSMKIPAGDYKATLYTHINSVNGEPFLKMAEKKEEKIGSYFRRTRSSEKMPSWLEYWIKAYPDEDPGHEDEWQSKPLPEVEPYVAFLLHLTPLQAKESLPETKPIDYGFFSCEHAQARKPAKCPLGLLGNDVQNLPKKAVETKREIVGIDVFSKARQSNLCALDEKVELGLGKLDLAFIVAWYASASAHPEFRIKHELAEELVASFSQAEDLQCLVAETKLVSFRFEETGARWGNLTRMKALAASVQEFSNLDAAEIELCIGLDIDSEKSYVRFKGLLIDGKWQIVETFPPLNHAVLEEALKLAEESCGGEHLELAPEHADECLALFEAEWRGLYRDSMPKLEGSKLTAVKSDATMLHLFSAIYFKEKFSSFWRVEPIDDEVRDKVKRNRLQKSLSAELVYEAPSGRKFLKSSIETLGKEAIASWEQLDREIQQLGGKLIGEIACSQFNDFVFRYYGMPDDECRFVCYRGGFNNTLVECISDFKDGSSLSTSRQAGSADDKEKKIFRTRMSGQSFAAIYAAHRARCAELQGKCKGYLRFDGSLLECARRFEEGIIRQS